jgi:microsomal dipeptidase-like Zn-dependent dipeptidase
MFKRVFKFIPLVLLLVLIAFFTYFPSHIDAQKNTLVSNPELPTLSPEAKALHETLFIGDWHSDSLMWPRNLMKENKRGHMDVPRLQQGNVAIQMFTTVTKAPSGLNYDSNEADASDDITLLAMVSLWPFKAWNSLTERALYMSSKIHKWAAEYPEDLFVISSKRSLDTFLEHRQSNSNLVGAMIGTEGSHALDGDINNIQRLYDNGFRMMSLQHFFDNKLGGSLHGVSGHGLTEFGQQVIEKMDDLDIIIDVAHSSEQLVKDVLSITSQPLVVSHTGFYGDCASARNISDELMQEIASRGGLIAVGYWDGAVCEASMNHIAQSISYGIQLVGADHVALGSDFDGSTQVPFDTSNMVYLTQALMDIGLSNEDIVKVMGGNMLNFLLENLPE